MIKTLCIYVLFQEKEVRPRASVSLSDNKATPTKSVTTPPGISASGSGTPKTEGQGECVTDPCCYLCEGPCDITFQPCGHTVMCAVCAEPVKRCPICKVSSGGLCSLLPFLIALLLPQQRGILQKIKVTA